MKHLDIKIYGKVQGVFYRISSKKEAKRLKIFGYVKNLNDGVVEIEVEGEENNLNKFLAWCREGSILARVAKVDYECSEKLKGYEDFEIRS